MFRYFSVLVIALTITACASTVRVDQDVSGNKTERIAGVPFYIKKQEYVHTTVRAATWLSSTLTVEKYIGIPSKTNDKAFETVTYNRQIAKSDADDLDEIRKAILDSSGGDITAAESIINNFLDLPANGGEDNAALSLVGNKVSTRWVVDGSKKYYLNAPLPWFGTSSLTQKINPDGTLSEIVAAPDTKLAEGLSTLIPFKEYLTGKYVDTLTGQSDTAIAEMMSSMVVPSDFPFQATVLSNRNVATQVYVLSLTTEETGYEYTFERVTAEAPKSASPIPFDTETEQFSRKSLKAAASKEAKKDASPKIGISGEVKLPEGWGKPAS